ncbi:hypothetical protein FB451DRAFT_1406600 [Mycena latifolia]|nr:hypothetical protein FB451DRAFT_1406600 [Mycena latifolia]
MHRFILSSSQPFRLALSLQLVSGHGIDNSYCDDHFCTEDERDRRRTRAIIIGASIAGVVLLLSLISSIFFVRRRRLIRARFQPSLAPAFQGGIPPGVASSPYVPPPIGYVPPPAPAFMPAQNDKAPTAPSAYNY